MDRKNSAIFVYFFHLFNFWIPGCPVVLKVRVQTEASYVAIFKGAILLALASYSLFIKLLLC